MTHQFQKLGKRCSVQSPWSWVQIPIPPDKLSNKITEKWLVELRQSEKYQKTKKSVPDDRDESSLRLVHIISRIEGREFESLPIPSSQRKLDQEIRKISEISEHKNKKFQIVAIWQPERSRATSPCPKQQQQAHRLPVGLVLRANGHDGIYSGKLQISRDCDFLL